MELFVQAWLIGLAVAAPVGPMALLCMERTLARGARAGLVFGLGIALADATYALLAGWGIRSLSELLLAATPWLRWLGGLLMLGFGLRILVSKAANEGPRQTAVEGNLQALATAYLLTMANPPTVLFFAGVFASLASGSAAGEPAAFTVGVFVGSFSWWLVFTVLLARGANFVDAQCRVWISRLAGAAIIAFALFSLARAIAD